MVPLAKIHPPLFSLFLWIRWRHKAVFQVTDVFTAPALAAMIPTQTLKDALQSHFQSRAGERPGAVVTDCLLGKIGGEEWTLRMVTSADRTVTWLEEATPILPEVLTQ
jgi:hypothetical protein